MKITTLFCKGRATLWYVSLVEMLADYTKLPEQQPWLALGYFEMFYVMVSGQRTALCCFLIIVQIGTPRYGKLCRLGQYGAGKGKESVIEILAGNKS